VLAYYECPMLCTQVLNGVTSSLKTLSFDIGTDYNVVTVSFNPRELPELAAAKKPHTSSGTTDQALSRAGIFSPEIQNRSTC